MNKYLIYADDNVLDLYPNTAFQITFNNLDIGDLTTRNTSFTNTISLPPTGNNLRTFGNCSPASSSELPYRKSTIRVIENGLQIFKGVGFLKKVSKNLSLSIFKNDIDQFDALKSVLVSEAETGNTFALTNTSMYNLRNAVNLICCPVVNWGKLNNLPSTDIENNDFSGSMEPWSTGGNVAWIYSSNAVSVTLNLNQNSSFLSNNTVTVYAGFKYRMTINGTLGSALGTTIYLVLSKQNRQTQGTVGSSSSSGAFSFTIDFNVDENYEGISIWAARTGSAGSNVITITDVTLSIDYDSFIELSYPFYLPMYNYMNVLQSGVAIPDDVDGMDEFNLTEEQEDFMESLLLAYSRDTVKYSDKVIEAHNLISSSNATQNITATDTNLKFQNHIKEWTKDFDSWDVNDEVLSLSTGSGGIYVDVIVSVSLTINSIDNGVAIKIVAEQDGGDLVESEEYDDDDIGQCNITIDSRQLLESGFLVNTISSDFHVYLVKTGMGSFDVDILSATIEIKMVEQPQDEGINGSSILFPDVPAFEFLKDYVIRTGSLIRYDENTLLFEAKPIENIIKDRHLSVDWTGKRVNTEEDDTQFELDGYAQSNIFKDSEQELESIGQMSLNVVNQNIELEKEYYTSIMQSKNDESVKSLYLGNTRCFEFDCEKVFTPNPINFRPYVFENANSIMAIMQTRSEESTDPEIYYGTTQATTYKVATYAKWSSFKELFYGALENALAKAKVVNHQYRLTANDINSLDLFKTIYDGDSYYLILSVKYTPGSISKVRLLKV